ncbi:MAG TPA: YceI family protein [Dissulfurispiraceae bacterium]|nr:YceI family protein [Dissulfurispiraceae bacterium]
MAKFKIDPDHSVAGFQVRHMMISNVLGQFNHITGTVIFYPDRVAESSVEVEIATSGIWTGIAKRDEHLRSADFLDVEKYPVMSFRSIRVEPAGSRRFRVFGELTLKGVTKTISFDAEYSGPVKDPFEPGTSYGFSASTKINREDFGIMWNVNMEGGFLVGKNLTISLEIEADLAE